MAKGKVYLIGAGPGDIGLMTVKGMKCLEKAEVVVYDYHLNAQVLNYINHEAEFIYAGKRGGAHTLTQDEINEVLVEKALMGKNVCRLKGGDPFVFGRGGEEAERLHAEGIKFEVVPGISSSIAAPAYAGIPLTHRNYSSTFAVIPGYEDVTKENSSIDWSKLATGVGTLVFLMAVKNIAELTQKLMDNGLKAETPVAVVRWGTRADQETLVSDLKNVAREVKERDIRPPAVMVVGEVVKLRETLNWYEQKPLFGMRILSTREGSAGFEELREMGAEVVEFPTIKVVPPSDWSGLDTAIEGIASGTDMPNWIIFTSVNGVTNFFERFIELGNDVRDMKGVQFCAIGSKTEEAINKWGIRVDFVPKKFNAEGMVDEIAKLSGDDGLKGKYLLLPRAEVARELFPEKVRELGGRIEIPVAYRAEMPTRRPKRLKRFLREGKISVVTFTSAATFDNFLLLVDDAKELLGNAAIASIGPVTTKAINDAGLSVAIEPEKATVAAMAEAIKEWASQETD
jgi:uroporphyrinogen III methyltransferase/synthase